jgi:hypothetical protein
MGIRQARALIAQTDGTQIGVAASIDCERKGPKTKRLTEIGLVYRLARFAVTFR